MVAAIAEAPRGHLLGPVRSLCLKSAHNSLTVGPDGPILLHDHHFIEQMAHFNRERVPERNVHAKGSGAWEPPPERIILMTQAERRDVHEVDILGEPYLSETIELPDDEEGPVVATLVHRRTHVTTGGSTLGAVLHLHGFSDYFFQTPAADYWTERGYDFYALDLRKYGRSLRPHQTPNFVTDLRHYFEEIDAAMERVTDRDGHTHVIVTAHSTGGLVAPLWADARAPRLAGMVLNSPWLDLHGSFLLRTAGTAAIDQVGARRPYLSIPRNVSGLYAQSLHKDHRGEWEFNLDWKPIESWPVYAGWLRAVRRGHARIHRGIEVGAPVLVLTSGASSFPREWEENVDRHDIVLDVEQIRKWAHKLGDHVTVSRIEGALHDVTLSAEPVRHRVFGQISRWLDAYVQEP